jgi:hypothetical protein
MPENEACPTPRICVLPPHYRGGHNYGIVGVTARPASGRSPRTEAQNPNIDLPLDLDDRMVKIVAAGYDAVVRHSPVVDDYVVVKRLAPSRRFLVAAPGYLC